MGEIVNLRRARKARQRLEGADAAAASRALHGRTRAQREADAVDKARAAKLLDGARRDTD